MVKMGTVASQKKLFFSLRRIKSQLKIHDNGELSDEQAGRISEAVGVTETEVQHMNRRLYSRDLSLNAPMSNSDEGSAEFQDSLVDNRPSPESLVGEREELSVRSAMLERALSELPERERHILIERRLKDDPVTLEELGTEYGISRERIRQLEVRAFDKLQKLIHAEAAAAPAM